MYKKYPLRKNSSGYIAILLCVIVPVLFFGVKYVLDLNTKHQVDLEKDLSSQKDGEHYKKCAKETALAVARNWNPGLTLEQQKDAIMKVADAVYNTSLSYNSSVFGKAIPGLDIKTGHTVTSNSTFGGIVVQHQETTSAAKGTVITYVDKAKYEVESQGLNYSASLSRVTWNPYFAMWRGIDKGTDSGNRFSIFDEVDEQKLQNGVFSLIHHDIYTNSRIYLGYMEYSYPTNLYYGSTDGWQANRSFIYWRFFNKTNNTSSNYNPLSVSSFATYFSGTTSSFSGPIGQSTYKERIAPSSPNCVQVSISGDKIMAKTDDDTGYAIPAQCNVDVVLAIPTNGAASNVNNRDASSDTAGVPWYGAALDSIPADAKTTPIYQMGQACKNFVKDNFYHTRGINMALIPYSGKVSTSPDKTSYTAAIPAFNSADFNNNNSSVMRGAFLYGTKGEKEAKLTNIYSWNTKLVGCPIMCRRGAIETSATYGNNQIAYGDLLSNANPNSDALRFQRMNLNPCYLGYANLLSLKCEKACTTFLPNPYYMIELTADLQKIYEMCNALYPVYDPRSVSNFIFIPVTWANNLFQSWTTDPSASATTDQLSRQTKTTSGRKKAVVLLVNKPDWFEPKELTYIGFDNDFSEISMAESDKIRFDVDYSDAGKKFIDGTNYDGTIQGAKKILKYTTQSGTVTRNVTSGYYETTGIARGRLSFPEKGLVKITLKGIPSWARIDNGSLASIGSSWSNIMHDGSRYVVVNSSGRVAVSDDGGINWTRIDNGSLVGSGFSDWNSIAYNGSIYVAINNGGNDLARTARSTDGGVSWTVSDSINGIYYRFWKDVVYANNKFLAMNSYADLATSNDGITWTAGSNSLSNFTNYGWHGHLIYDGSRLIAVNTNGINSSYTTGLVAASSDGVTWTRISDNTFEQTLGSNSYHTAPICYDGSKYVIRSSTNKLFYSSNGVSWTEEGSLSFTPMAFYYRDGRYLALTSSGYIYGYGSGIISSTFKPANLINGGDNTSRTVPTTETTFYIEPSQISGSSGNYYIDFDMKDIKLISAEITNRSYEPATCSLSGTTNAIGGTGTAYIDTNVKEPLILKARAGYETGTMKFSYADGTVNETLTSPKTYKFLYAYPDTNKISYEFLRALHWATGMVFLSWGKIFGDKKQNYTDLWWMAEKVAAVACFDNMFYYKNTAGVSAAANVIDIGSEAMSGIDISELGGGLEMNNRFEDACDRSNRTVGNLFYSELRAAKDAGTSDVVKYENLERICVDKVDELSKNYIDTAIHSANLADCVSWYGRVSCAQRVQSYKTNPLATNIADKSVEMATGFSNNSSWCLNNYSTIIDWCKSVMFFNNSFSHICPTAAYFSKLKEANQHVIRKMLCSCMYYQNPSDYYRYYDVDGYADGTSHIDDIYSMSISFSTHDLDVISIIHPEISIGETLVKGQETPVFTCLLEPISADGPPPANKKYYHVYPSEVRELHVTVQPNISGTIKNTTPSDTASVTTINSTDYQTITIDPSTHKFELQSNGTYKITIILNNIQLDTAYNGGRGVAFANTVGNAFSYPSTTMPAMSRNIDFSKNIGGKPEYNPSECVYGSTIAGDIVSTTKYEDGFWTSTAGSNEFFSRGIIGDFNFTLEDISERHPSTREYYSTMADPSYKLRETIHFSGYRRIFKSAEDMGYGKGCGDKGTFALSLYVSGGDNGKARFISSQFTWPINTVLWAGAGESALHKYAWQSDTSGNVSTYDANAASRKVTISACSKLKSDFGSNIRIYVVKYRKQQSWKHKMTDAITNHDYSPVDGCASSSSYVYDVSTENDLKVKLNTIAADIKTFAGYQEAKNVE